MAKPFVGMFIGRTGSATWEKKISPSFSCFLVSYRRTQTVPAGKTLLTPEGSLTAVMKSLYSVKLSSD